MKKNTSLALNDKKIVIISHVFVSGPAQALLEFLTQVDKINKVLFIGHPLFYQPNQKVGSFSELYIRGKKARKESFKNFYLPPILSYFKDLLLSFYWVIKSKEKWDLIVAADNLNALAGIILRNFRRTQKVVFYTVDYVPRRFENNLLNEIYHWMDKFCVYHADRVWNLSPMMAKARKKYRGIDCKKQLIVPMGIWFKKIKRKPFRNINKTTLVFMGHLIKKQGVQKVIRAVPKIIKEIPNFKFLIIGTGEYKEELEKLTEKLKVNKYVKFSGYIEDYHEMENLIAQCASAIAPYQKGNKERNFTYYSDPGKIKDYLGAGLPVITTNVPYNSKEIERRKCGIIVDYTKEDIARAIIELMKDEEKLRVYRENTVEYAKKFEWNKVFEKALSMTF